MTLSEVPDITTEAMEVNEDTIQILEQYLKDAREGIITELIMVGMNKETSTIKTTSSQTLSITNQLGCLEIAKANLLAAVIAKSVIQNDSD